MHFYESVITVMLKKDIHFQNAQEVIGSFINEAMLKDEDLKSLHGKIGIKGYTFTSLFPLEKSKIYQANKIYVFRIRALKENYLTKLGHCLRKLKYHQLQVIAIERRLYANKLINDIYSITPVIVTVNNQPWMQEDDVDLFIRRLEENAEKKLSHILGENVEDSHFVQAIEFVNRKPVSIAYKGIRLLGHKVKIAVHPHKDAQKLAHVVLGAGLGEKNSVLGCGYCFANFI